MPVRVDPNTFEGVISEMLSKYGDDVTDIVTDIAKGIAEDGAQKLREVTGTYDIKTGDYNRGWTSEETTKKKKRLVIFKIHNGDEYRLTHLLEYGHATRNGKRTKEFEHIKPVEEWCKRTYVNSVHEAIRRVG